MHNGIMLNREKGSNYLMNLDAVCLKNETKINHSDFLLTARNFLNFNLNKKFKMRFLLIFACYACCKILSLKME